MQDRAVVQIAVVGLLLYINLGLAIVAGLIWRGTPQGEHILAVVGLIGPAVGAVCTLITNPRATTLVDGGGSGSHGGSKGNPLVKEVVVEPSMVEHTRKRSIALATLR